LLSDPIKNFKLFSTSVLFPRLLSITIAIIELQILKFTFYFNTHAVIMHYLNYAIFSLVYKVFDNLDIIMVNRHVQ
jgi:putative effector of murein hydrolase